MTLIYNTTTETSRKNVTSSYPRWKHVTWVIPTLHMTMSDLKSAMKTSLEATNKCYQLAELEIRSPQILRVDHNTVRERLGIYTCKDREPCLLMPLTRGWDGVMKAALWVQGVLHHQGDALHNIKLSAKWMHDEGRQTLTLELCPWCLITSMARHSSQVPIGPDCLITETLGRSFPWVKDQD